MSDETRDDSAELTIESLRLWRQEAREIVVHEDNLINIRMGWLTAIQTILLSGIFLGPDHLRETIFIPSIGTMSSLMILWGIVTADWALFRIGKEWKEKKDAASNANISVETICRPVGYRQRTAVFQFLQPHSLLVAAFVVIWPYLYTTDYGFLEVDQAGTLQSGPTDAGHGLKSE